MDDIIVYAKDKDQFLARLREVFNRLNAFGLTLNKEKCTLGCSKVDYLGWEISEHGQRISESRLQGIKDLERAHSRKDVQVLLGFLNYLRGFVPHYSSLMEPIIRLLNKSTVFAWGTEQDRALEAVKEHLLDGKCLAPIKDEGELILYTDASSIAVGGVLMQVQEGIEAPICFLSKKLTEVQQRWTVGEQEAWGVVYSVLQCASYLRGRHFTLKTDHRNLVYVQKTPNAKTTRWRLRLEEFDFDIQHIPGTSNILADALSRLKSPEEAVSLKSLSELQPAKRLMVRLLKSQEYHMTSAETSSLIQREDGIWTNKDGLAVVPKKDISIKEMLLKYAHGKTHAHLGEEATRSIIIGMGITWVGIHSEVHRHVQECLVCQKLRLRHQGVQYSRSTATSLPFETIAIDSLGPLPETKSGNKYIVVCIDCFSRYATLTATNSTSAAEAASSLLNSICFVFGTPKYIRSDRGPQYHNALIETLCASLGIKHHEVLPHNPAANGIVERANREVMKMMKGFWLEGAELEEWDMLLPKVQFIFNNQKHHSLGFTPHQLIYGAGILASRTNVCIDPGVTIESFSADARAKAKDYVRELSDDLEALQSRARETQRRLTQDTSDESLDETALPLGSYVWVIPVVQHKKKTSFQLLGPRKVVGRPSAVVYEVEDLSTKQKCSLPLHRLRPVKGTVTEAEALRLAARDDHEYVSVSIESSIIAAWPVPWSVLIILWSKNCGEGIRSPLHKVLSYLPENISLRLGRVAGYSPGSGPGESRV
ncbi:gag-pol polyprotein [Aduncisulcus paluster]|uniref:Gag-pol polyprotein n=1 Tax=Aduncisulcus paluster TaxID=2918883 RepID=A0ABQ5JSV4_9EUKA|nr:gag-pol polyprotein [Aduncisulcus paluster]